MNQNDKPMNTEKTISQEEAYEKYCESAKKYSTPLSFEQWKESASLTSIPLTC
jgi:hypothetical protein